MLSFFFTLGRPFSPIYGWLMTTRAALFRKNIFRQHSLPVPVISIGNLTMGGSGKTPVVMYLANLLKENGYSPAIISRGYGGKSTGKCNIVTVGDEPLLTAEDAGDEPFMLAKGLKGIPVITGKSRIHPCRHAVETLKADVILLDDGFQHIAIKRNIDIVLFNATTLAGNSRVFPGGILREPVNALERCHAFMLTGVTEDNRERAGKFAALLKKRFPDKPLFSTKIGKIELRLHCEKRTVADPSALGQMYGFCAIANPVRFHDSIKTIGASLVRFRSFRDHKNYSQRTIDKLCREAETLGAAGLLTTEKDFVKISQYRLTLPLYVLEVKIEPDDKFEEYVLEKIPRV